MAGAGLYEVGPGKTYATIQGALDQLWTDQGAATFTASQYIRIFAGTYDENLEPNTSLDPDEAGGFLLVFEGDPADDRDNIVIAPAAGSYGLDVNCNQILVRHLKLAGTPDIYMIRFNTKCVNPAVFDCVFTGAKPAIWARETVRISDCDITVTTDTYAILGGYSFGDLDVRRCKIVGPGKAGSTKTGIYSRNGRGMARIEGCVISGFQDGIRFGSNTVEGNADIANNTLYDCNYGIGPSVYTGFFQRTVINNIFKDVDYPYKVIIWPEETATQAGSIFVQRNNCYHGYTAFAYDAATATKTYAEWIALGQVDAAGELDATDPLLTDPGAGNFTLQAASPCRHIGHGSGVISDVAATAYDAHHPDIGAMSTGALTVAAPAISTTVDDETGSSATFTLSADNIQDVLTVHYRRRLETEWTTFGTTRTGSGSLQITGLVKDQNYWFIVTASRAGEISLPSHAASVTITTGDWEATLEAAFRTRLLENATVENLVGVRLYAVVAPQDVTLPYGVATVISDMPWHHMLGASRLARARVQLDLYADSHPGVKALAKACREALDGLDRPVTVGSDTNELQITMEMQADGDHERASGAELGAYRVTQDYVVLHQETLPALA